MRLIDIDAIPKSAWRGDVYDLQDALWTAETVDAVPVVHCADCKHYIPWKGQNCGECKYMMNSVNSDVLEDDNSYFETEPDWFCGSGKRKDT